MLASGSVDGTVRLWEVESAGSLATLEGHSSGVHGVALSSDGRLVAGGSVDGSLKLWEVVSGRLLETLDVPNGGIWSVALRGDAQLIAAGGEDGMVRLWELPAGGLVSVLDGHSPEVWSQRQSRRHRPLVRRDYRRTAAHTETPHGRHLERGINFRTLDIDFNRAIQNLCSCRGGMLTPAPVVPGCGRTGTL